MPRHFQVSKRRKMKALGNRVFENHAAKAREAFFVSLFEERRQLFGEGLFLRYSATG